MLAPRLEPRFTSLKGSEMPGQCLIKGFSGHFVQIDQWGQRHQVEYIFESSGGLHLVFLLINTKHIGHLKVLSENTHGEALSMSLF